MHAQLGEARGGLPVRRRPRCDSKSPTRPARPAARTWPRPRAGPGGRRRWSPGPARSRTSRGPARPRGGTRARTPRRPRWESFAMGPGVPAPRRSARTGPRGSGDLLGQHHRVALGQDDDSGPQLHRRRVGGEEAQGDQRVQDRMVRLHRRGRLPRVRENDVLAGPHRLEPDALGQAGTAASRTSSRTSARSSSRTEITSRSLTDFASDGEGPPPSVS